MIQPIQNMSYVNWKNIMGFALSALCLKSGGVRFGTKNLTNVQKSPYKMKEILKYDSFSAAF